MQIPFANSPYSKKYKKKKNPTAIRKKNKGKQKNKMQKYTKNINKKKQTQQNAKIVLKS